MYYTLIPGSCASGAICDGVNEGHVQHVPVHPGIAEPCHVVKMSYNVWGCMHVHENFKFNFWKEIILCPCIQRHGLESELCT